MKRFLWLMSGATLLALVSYLPQLGGSHAAHHEPTRYGVALMLEQAWPQPDETGPNCGVSCGASRRPAKDPTVIHRPSIRSLVRSDDKEAAVSLKAARQPIATTSTSASTSTTSSTTSSANTSNAPANLSPALKRVFTECARHETVKKSTCKSHGFPGGK